MDKFRLPPGLKHVGVLFLLTWTLWGLVLCADAGFTAGEEDSIDRFRKYLTIHTEQPKPDYEGAADFLFSQAKEIGLDVQRIDAIEGKPIILMTWQGKEPSLPSILLNSHIDVVPVEQAKWSHDAFEAVRTASGDIYARGSQDMKCVAMQYLEAIRVLRDGHAYEPSHTVHLSFVPDEEIGGHDGMGMLVDWAGFAGLNVGFALDEGVVSTGANYRVFNAERGAFWTLIKAVGPPGHGSMLYDGSATENLLRSLTAILEFRKSQFDLIRAGTASIGDVISVNVDYLRAGIDSPSGPVINVQPSEAVAGIDFRLPPATDVEAFTMRLAEEWAPAHRNMTFTVRQGVTKAKDGGPLITPVDDSNPYWAVFKNAVHKTGVKLDDPEIFPASTDARYLRAYGLPVLGFTPVRNTPVLLHAHNEYVNDKCFVEGIAAYVNIIRDLSSMGAKSIEEERGAQRVGVDESGSTGHIEL